jgi:hypothetical protein
MNSLLEFKLQFVPFHFQPPSKLKLELQRLQIERAWWRERLRISKSILIQFKPVERPRLKGRGAIAGETFVGGSRQILHPEPDFRHFWLVL